MKLSARNALKGTVKEVEHGAVNSEVTGHSRETSPVKTRHAPQEDRRDREPLSHMVLELNIFGVDVECLVL
jgi:hypothetical protein